MNIYFLYNLFKNLVSANQVLQTFHLGYISDINTGNLLDNQGTANTPDNKQYPLLLCEPLKSQQKHVGRTTHTEVFYITLHFFALQFYKNDNSEDTNHRLIDYWAEMRKVVNDYILQLTISINKWNETQGQSSCNKIFVLGRQGEKNGNFFDIMDGDRAYSHNDKLVEIIVRFQLEVCKEGVTTITTFNDTALPIQLPTLRNPNPISLLHTGQEKF